MAAPSAWRPPHQPERLGTRVQKREYPLHTAPVFPPMQAPQSAATAKKHARSGVALLLLSMRHRTGRMKAMDRIDDRGNDVDRPQEPEAQGPQNKTRVTEDGPSAEERRRDAYRLR